MRVPGVPSMFHSPSVRPASAKLGSRLLALATAIASAALFAVAGAPPGVQAASSACPWVGSSAPIPQRVSQVIGTEEAVVGQRVNGAIDTLESGRG